ncbi:MAG: hypothetical protein ACI88G_000296, partial [Woeseiaceae bacterium]
AALCEVKRSEASHEHKAARRACSQCEKQRIRG